MYIIKQKLKNFSAAHRLTKGYQGECSHLHGHTYQVLVVLTASELDRHGLMIDFSDITRLCSDWVQKHWDHGVLISDDDEPLIRFVRENKQKHFVLPGNSSAECLSKFLFDEFALLMEKYNRENNKAVDIQEVHVFESENSCAIYSSSKV